MLIDEFINQYSNIELKKIHARNMVKTSQMVEDLPSDGAIDSRRDSLISIDDIKDIFKKSLI